MKKYALPCIWFCISLVGCSQKIIPQFDSEICKPITIVLPSPLDSISHQYSGLTIYKDRLYLLRENHVATPQPPKYIYSVMLDSIRHTIDATKPDSPLLYRRIHINTDSLIGIQHYEGLEAIVIRNRMVYILIETNSLYKDCYIAKGILNETEDTITLNKTCQLPRKTTEIYNAGFESLAWDDNEKNCWLYMSTMAIPKTDKWATL